MAEQFDLNTPPSDDAPSERERVLRDFGKDFSENKREADARQDRPKDDRKPDAPVDGKDARDAAAPQRPRDEKTGKFAPKPEPFEGFSKLDPKVQDQWNALARERDRYKNDYSAVAGRLPGAQREVESLRARLQQQNPTQRDQIKTQAKLDAYFETPAWKDHESRFPEEAAAQRGALQATIDDLTSKVTDSANPLNQKVQQLESRLGELDAKERIAVARKAMGDLSERHPEWMKIAGWEDDDGNYIPDLARRQWHPWFSAWKESLPTPMQRTYDQLLDTMDVDSIDYVLSHFKRDVQAAQGEQGQSGQARQGDDLAQRRAEALRDTSPRPSPSGADSPKTLFDKRGNADEGRMAVLDRYYDTFKAGQRL